MSDLLHDEHPISTHQELLDRARARNPEAFTRLYETTNRRVFGYLLAHVADRSAAEDLLQEVYLASFRGLDRFRGRSEIEFLAWLLAIARSKLVDRVRRSRRRPEILDGDLGTRQPMANPDDTIDRREQSRQLSAALARLTQEQRDVVVSRMVMGLSLEETARLVHKNTGSVKALQHRALARLARVLGELGWWSRE